MSVISNTDAYEDARIKIRIKARTPQQMAAFYEARGFPGQMIDALDRTCFFTIGIKNKTSDILWHDLSRWKFHSAGKEVHRYDRRYWQRQWQDMAAPMASQSTFRWTLLPEQLDFRPQESEGGNIILPRGPLVYDLEARFATGATKKGVPIIVKLNNIRCAEDRTSLTP